MNKVISRERNYVPPLTRLTVSLVEGEVKGVCVSKGLGVFTGTFNLNVIKGKR